MQTIEISNHFTFVVPQQFQGLRVLVVDDAALVRKMTAKLLTQYGISVGEASNGLEAIAQVKLFNSKAMPFDAIFMDSQMRIMDGPTAAAELRRVGFKGKIYGVTGSSEEKGMNNFLNNGADRVVIKPLTKSTLIMLLEGKSELLC